MEHISLASRTTPRRVRLVAHALAPQVEVELLEGMQQQYTRKKNHMVCIVPKTCNILTRMLNSSVHRLFSEKTALGK